MKKQRSYTRIPLTFNRRMVAISASITGEKNLIHSMIEVDVHDIRKILREHRDKTGEQLSFTAWIVFALAGTLIKYPHFNAFRKGRKLVLLNDITISVLVERKLNEEKVPEPLGIQEAQNKSYRRIHDEIRQAQQQENQELGGLSKMTWVKYIPSFLMRTFFRLASASIRMNIRYGVVSVTAVGMFGKSANWFIPHGGATILLTVGSIAERPVLRDGKYENREHLCLTISFDHAVIDGAPGARFSKDLSEALSNRRNLEYELSTKDT
jgi:pyruvate/2-oxoglutarate dehydrogenase complex dihydrolipoamide acyltransferase (E2) component